MTISSIKAMGESVEAKELIRATADDKAALIQPTNRPFKAKLPKAVGFLSGETFFRDSTNTLSGGMEVKPERQTRFFYAVKVVEIPIDANQCCYGFGIDMESGVDCVALEHRYKELSDKEAKFKHGSNASFSALKKNPRNREVEELKSLSVEISTKNKFYTASEIETIKKEWKQYSHESAIEEIESLPQPYPPDFVPKQRFTSDGKALPILSSALIVKHNADCEKRIVNTLLKMGFGHKVESKTGKISVGSPLHIVNEQDPFNSNKQWKIVKSTS